MRFNKPLIVGIIFLILWFVCSISKIGQTVTFTYWFPLEVLVTFSSAFLCGFFAGMEK